MTSLPAYFRTLHRPVWAEIDLDNITQNIREFQRILPAKTQIMAVVKADAYGHGAEEVAQTALAAGAARLGVALIEEGIVLRRKGIAAPIQILGISAPGTEQAVLAHHLIPTICSIESAHRFSEAGRVAGQTVPFHLKLDTGMGRIGIRIDQLAEFLKMLKPLPNLHMEGVFSHFSKADESDKTYTTKQFRLYQQGCDILKEAGFVPQIRCLANSAGTIEIPEALFNMVRIGISLYGLYPSDDVEKTRITLDPVMQWKTQIVHLKELPPGEAISYGGMFITSRPTNVATLPVGYADGFRRRLWKTGGHVLVKGRRVPIIGRICMDMCMLDVTDVPDIAVGDEVVLIGTQEAEHLPVEEMAARLDTINYEITCLVGKRVPRIFRKDGRVVKIKSLLGEMTEETLDAKNVHSTITENS